MQGPSITAGHYTHFTLFLPVKERKDPGDEGEEGSGTLNENFVGTSSSTQSGLGTRGSTTLRYFRTFLLVPRFVSLRGTTCDRFNPPDLGPFATRGQRVAVGSRSSCLLVGNLKVRLDKLLREPINIYLKVHLLRSHPNRGSYQRCRRDY